MGWGEAPPETTRHREWVQQAFDLRRVRDLIIPPMTSAQRDEALALLDALLERPER